MSWLKKKLEEATAQINPFDGGKTASTVRAARPVPPAQTRTAPVRNPIVGRNETQPGFQITNNSLTRGLSRGFDQANVFDNNRTWKQRKPTEDISAIDQAGRLANKTGAAVSGGTARLLNTVSVQQREIAPTIKAQIASMTNNQPALANALDEQDKVRQDYRRNEGGLFNAGTLYDSEEARKGDLTTGVKRIGGGTAESALEVGSLGLGGFAGKQIVNQGIKQGIKSQVPTIAKNAVLNTAQGATQAFNQDAGVKDIAKSAAIGGAVGTVADVGLGVAGAGATKLTTKLAPTVSKVASDVVRPAKSLTTNLVKKVDNAIQAPKVRAQIQNNISNMPDNDRAIYEGLYRYHSNKGSMNPQEANFLLSAGRQLDQKYGIDSGVSGTVNDFKTRIEGVLDQSINPQPKRPSLLADEGGYAKNPFYEGDELTEGLSKEQSDFINQYANMLEDMGSGNGVAINPETGARISSNFRDAELGSGKVSKAEWFDQARKELESGKGAYGASDEYKSLPRMNGVEPKITETAPKLDKTIFESNLEQAGIKPTGTKVVRKDIPETETSSATSPIPEKAVDLSQVKPAKQTKAPQIEDRANASTLRQDDSLNVETPQKTVGKLQSDQANKVNPSSQERGFIETIIDNPNTSPQVKESLSSLYSVRNTKQLQTKAANLVKSDPDLAMRVAKEDTSDVGVATASELIKKLQNDGNFEQAIDVASSVAEILTKAGQTAQAASIYGRLTPAGVLRFTQKELNKYNKATGKNIKISPEVAKDLTEKATKIQGMPEGRAKDIATKEMLKQVYETMPATWVEKVSTFQTMAQLLNPKTLIRNLGGNTIFSVLDNTSQVLASGIDKTLSAVKGTARTTGLPNLKTQVKGVKKGFSEGYEEAVKGINLGPNTQFDLNEVPVFRDGFLGQAEKALNVSLRATDRGAYKAAFDDTLDNLLKLNKTKTPTTEMIEMAHHQGLYRTFQDDSNAAKIFVGLKKSLNIAGFEKNGKKWGLGDLILKYPKTPGNLIARGVDYSPVGIIRGMIELAKPNGSQQIASNSLARGVVGSGTLIGTGYALAGLGLITEKPEENKDLRNLQKTAGLGGYQLNTSGLKRFLLSGFDTEEAKLREGDKLVSYDWAQPAAIPLSMGASMGRGESVSKGAKQGVSALSEGVQTLAEQPLVRGVQDFFGSNKGATDSVIDAVKGAPASFVPTLSNQVRQLTDNTSRNTSDPSALKEAYNKAINRLPGLAGTLPASVDTLGNEKQNYQNGSNNPYNVFLNPAFVNEYKPNNVATTNLNLNRTTGETKQLPNTVSNKVKINGEDRQLTGKEQGEYQKYVGQTNSTVTNMLTKNDRFNALPDTQKVNLLAGVQTDINNAAKIKLFGDNPDKITEPVQRILDGQLGLIMESKLDNQEKSGKKTSTKTKTGKKTSKGKKRRKSKGRKGSSKAKFDYTKNLFDTNTSSTSVSKSLRQILENATKG